MNNSLGTTARPLRVAIIGAGPSGYYAAGALIGQSAVQVSIDILEKLPAPFGLVRYGVAPDHEKIKNVIRVYQKTSADPRVRFFGNLTYGKDITQAELCRFYDALIYATGASSDRQLGIPGENLAGSHSATEFVGWYNAHPDYRDLQFDLAHTESAVVVGNGNVAMDVVRILAKAPDALQTTDIADHALDALRTSRIKTIYMLGRRGPAQAAFTHAELREFGEIQNAEVVVAPSELELDSHSLAMLHANGEAIRNVETLKQYMRRPRTGRPRQIVLRFLVSPIELMGDGRVQQVRIEHNELKPNASGVLQAQGKGIFETLPVDIIFRSIGYKGLPLPDVPYDVRSGTIPNQHGRIIDPQTRQPLAGEYVVGWAKRGPTGVIGTNKPDAVETVEALLNDVPNLNPVADAEADPHALESFIKERCPQVVSYQDWQILDQLETAKGKPQSRPRVKFSRVEEMLEALARKNGLA